MDNHKYNAALPLPMQPKDASRRSPRRKTALPLLEVMLALSLFFAVATTGGASAASPQEGGAVHAATASCNGNATCDLDSTLSNIQYFLIGIGVLLAGIAFAVYGIQYLAGALDEMPPEKRFQRKKQFTEIMVGLVIVMMSAVLVTVAKGLIVTS